MEYGFGSLKEGNKTFGVLSIEVKDDKTFYTKSDFVNLKVVEQERNFSILLSFIDLFQEKVLTYELSLGSNSEIIRSLKKFILQIKKNSNLYYLKIKVLDDDINYKILVNAGTNEVVSCDF